MKLFKSIDEKFAEIEFRKISEDEYGAEYERKDEKHGYTQSLALLNKQSGKHIVQ